MTKLHNVAVLSDIHFPHHHLDAVTTAQDILLDINPELVILNGDIIDLESLSRFDPTDKMEVHVAREIDVAVDFANSFTKNGIDVVFVPGNHESRFEKSIYGDKRSKLRGLSGLTLKEQFYARGLDKNARWLSEAPGCPGWWHSSTQTLVRHGDRQSSGSGSVNIAHKLIRENPGINVVHGHHHKAQMQTQTVLKTVRFGISNPHLSGDHDYASHPNWQRGFTLLQFVGASRLRDCTRVFPHIVLIDEDGVAAYGGKVYGLSK